MKKAIAIIVFGLLWCNAASSHGGHTFEFMKSGFIYNDNGIVKYVDGIKYKRGDLFNSTILYFTKIIYN